ncbi:hypothetical protein CFC21_078917 [Triticum aestivum]|uniref:UspA domain-containing protein n=4 Tax=Triticinae TaxID=1648030 RepID=A0A9R1L1D2_WHEAT|nr:uncharacterized protein LOC109746610 isoform X1 [Aegilops tauschii subsp. strangulata]XP_044398539.1 uncharacterized protein LOC123122413 isoform X1 [Triticum aestivum]KAF7074004.1 hypothetical protein CFC21_078915 [Triticum aestivum]KAF7074007.1 hypothetical protein CFC21_078917 [Triticum aestivum]
MAFASSLLPAPASGVRASHAPELAFPPVNRKGGVSLRRRGARHGGRGFALSLVRAEVNESASALAIDALSQVKHVLLPITDRNPYLSEGTRQAAATTTSLAKKYGANITVVVIDDKPKESFPEHDTQMSSIRWHLSEGGFTEFGLMERLGEGKKPTAIIAEVADDLELDLVVLSMEAIHSKQVDGNLLAEFIPCPILMLPL